MGYSFNKDKTITFTNTLASIVFKPDGSLNLDARGALNITANGTLRLSGMEVLIDGKPNVYVNCDTVAAVHRAHAGRGPRAQAPGGPGSGGETIEAQSLLSGHGTVGAARRLRGGVDRPRLARAARHAGRGASLLNIGGDLSSSIGAAVSNASHVTDAAESLNPRSGSTR